MIASLENSLQLIEIFASVQGESSFIGLPTTFIRLAACNLRCSWCDTTYSFSRGESWPISTILTEVERLKCPYICITGGEPLLQENIYPLMSHLCDLGYQLNLETGGSLSISRVDPRIITILDVKCPGSGMAHKNFFENLSLLRAQDEVKFVLADREDYEYAKGICSQYTLYRLGSRILFSPVHGKLDPKELVQWILKDQLPVRLNLQMHKYIWDPTTRGV